MESRKFKKKQKTRNFLKIWAQYQNFLLNLVKFGHSFTQLLHKKDFPHIDLLNKDLTNGKIDPIH